MNTNDLPPSIVRLEGLALLHWFETGGGTDGPVHTIRVRELHAQALGPRRRKREAVFELRDEREVLEWLRLHQLTLFIPSAQAALRSVIEDGRLGTPPIGKRYSVYAMLPGARRVALVRHDTDLGQRIVNGQVELPYDTAAQTDVSEIGDPFTRVISAAVLDAHAASEATIPTAEL